MARELKDSGVAWIGVIPDNWGLKKLKYCASFIQEKYNTDMGVLPYIGLENIVSWNGKYIETDSEYDRNQSQVFQPDDILWGKLRPYLAKVYHARETGCCSGEFCVIRIDGTFDKRYFWNLLISSEFVSTVDRSTYGTKMPRANAEFIKNIIVPIPPVNEQKLISSYLDSQCARIDAVIEKTRASIEEYKKLKQAVITQAVTKGIRPGREMKDSKRDRIKEIPVEWDIINAHRIISSTQNGLTRRDLEQSAGQVVLKLKNISPSGTIDYATINRINLSEDELSRYTLQDGDFLFVRVNGSKALVGKCAIFSAISEPVAYNDHIIRVRLNNLIIKRFFQFYLLSNLGRAEIDLRTSTAAGQYTISGESLRDIIVILPPLEEQKEIVQYLDEKTQELDRVIDLKEKTIIELESYKKSLVFEYVTGKRETPII